MSFYGEADRKLVVVLAVSLLCSAGQSFSHQSDTGGILLSSEDARSGRVDYSSNVKKGYCPPSLLKRSWKLSDNEPFSLLWILAK